LAGKTLMVVGPPRAGKSTFMDYLSYGIFQHEQETERTYEAKRARDFKLSLGRDRALSASIKTAVDMPGDPNPKLVVDEVFKRRPHGLIVMLDLTTPLDDDDPRYSAAWLRRFCRAAEQRAFRMRPRRNRLRSIVVAMNKADKVDGVELQRRERVFRGIMEQDWLIAGGSHAIEPRFRPCIAVENDEKTRWVDAILVDVAKGLA
jgi:signal recognition particle receptor subunit beta